MGPRLEMLGHGVGGCLGIEEDRGRSGHCRLGGAQVEEGSNGSRSWKEAAGSRGDEDWKGRGAPTSPIKEAAMGR